MLCGSCTAKKKIKKKKKEDLEVWNRMNFKLKEGFCSSFSVFQSATTVVAYLNGSSKQMERFLIPGFCCKQKVKIKLHVSFKIKSVVTYRQSEIIFIILY